MELAWAWIGKILVLLSAALTSIKIFSLLKSGRKHIVAKVQPFYVFLPPHLRLLSKKFTENWREVSFSLKHTDNESHNIALEELKNISERFSYNGDLYKACDICGCWNVEVKNRSTVPCKNIHLTVPHAICAVVSKNNETSLTNIINNIIRIEEIRPDETVDIKIWTGYEASYYYAKKITLTHDSGKGAIKPIDKVLHGSPLKSPFNIHMYLDAIPVVFATVTAIWIINNWMIKKTIISNEMTNKIEIQSSTNSTSNVESQTVTL